MHGKGGRSPPRRPPYRRAAGGPLRTHARAQFLARFRSYRFLGLLLALMALLIGSSVLGTEAPSRVAVAFLLSILLFAMVTAASDARHLHWIAGTLAAVTGTFIVVGLLLDHRVIYLPAVILLTIYMTYTIGVALRRMVTVTEIDADILCGAAAIYLLIGVAWAMTYWIIFELDKAGFAGGSGNLAPNDLHRFLYYSLSTLTSLGIGDITPVNRFAQIWTTLETATGNLYLAVLVARLVSLYR